MNYFDEDDYEKALYSNEEPELFLMMYELVEKEVNLIRNALLKYSEIKLKKYAGISL